VLLAINTGGVIVSRECLFNVSEQEFDLRIDTFRKKHHEYFITFMTEQDLESMIRGIDERRRRP